MSAALKVGVTATRHGLTDEQSRALEEVLWSLERNRGGREFHHGDCVGGDEVGAVLAAGMGYHTVAHPGRVGHLRAYHPSQTVMPVADYLVRNRTIVDTCDVLIACPRELTEQQRSGTWSTIRYARSVRRWHIVVTPDGEIHNHEITGVSS